MSDALEPSPPTLAPSPVDAPSTASPVPPAALPPDDPTTADERGHTLPAARPHDGFVPVRRWVVDSPAGLRALRAELREQLSASTSGRAVRPARIAETAVLVTSELATNALTHGRPPAHVRLALDGHLVLVVVSDDDAAHAPFLAEGRAPGEGGFGLQIARRLAHEVGWWVDDAGKHVWATFDVDATS